MDPFWREALLPNPVIFRVDSDPMSSVSDPRAIASADFDKVVDRHWEKLERFCSFGPFHNNLPRPVRKAAVIASVPIGAFKRGLTRRKIVKLRRNKRRYYFLLDKPYLGVTGY